MADDPFAIHSSLLGVRRSTSSADATLVGCKFTALSKYTPEPRPMIKAAATTALVKLFRPEAFTDWG